MQLDNKTVSGRGELQMANRGRLMLGARCLNDLTLTMLEPNGVLDYDL